MGLLSGDTLLLLVVLLAIGSTVGRLTIAGVAIGPAAVLFSAIVVSAIGVEYGHQLMLPHEIGELGLILFTYTVGVIAGPGFFGSLRRAWPVMLTITLTLLFTAVAAVLLGRLLDIDTPIIAGTFAGGLTNTPALAAATEASSRPGLPVIGYSITYIYGVIGMLLAAAWALRERGNEAPPAPPIERTTIRVEREDNVSVEAIKLLFGDVTFTRVRRGSASNPSEVVRDQDRFGFNDLVIAVGPRDVVEPIVAFLGHVSSHDLSVDSSHVEIQRITLSNAKLAGHSLDSLHLRANYGAVVSRVRRGDIDMLADGNFIVQMGDRLQVIAEASRMEAIGKYLGDSQRGASDINPRGLAIGLTLGYLIGGIPFPLPGGEQFKLGAAAGTLIVGLVFGRIGRIGKLVTSMSVFSAQAISHLGMVLFLAYAGTRAGQRITGAISSELGWRIALLGVMVTTIAALSYVVVVPLVHKIKGTQLAGLIGGAQTQPAVLAFVNDHTGFDTRGGLGYALVFPIAMIAKIIIAQLIVTFA